MEESFKIEIPYENEVHEFEARIIWIFYQHKIEVIVDNIPVLFEPDEERNYRAVVNVDIKYDRLKPGKLQTIAEYLESILKN